MNEKLYHEWCPKLQLCYEESCSEINNQIIQNYTDYAIYPLYIINFVKSCDKTKTIDFCFMGAFAFRRGQEIGYNNRKWVFNFVDKHFTNDSFFVNTTKNKNLKSPWKLLGPYDKTFDESVIYSAPKYMENKNYFDKNYYKTMCKSKFCLCPAGDLMWSMRFYEALLCGCIPIVDCIEETYRNELESKIPYKFYFADEPEFIYHESWVKHNYNLFIKYHSFIPQ